MSAPVEVEVDAVVLVMSSGDDMTTLLAPPFAFSVRFPALVVVMVSAVNVLPANTTTSPVPFGDKLTPPFREAPANVRLPFAVLAVMLSTKIEDGSTMEPALKEPATFRLPPIPAPPVTKRAPVVGVVDAVVFVISKGDETVMGEEPPFAFRVIPLALVVVMTSALRVFPACTMTLPVAPGFRRMFPDPIPARTRFAVDAVTEGVVMAPELTTPNVDTPVTPNVDEKDPVVDVNPPFAARAPVSVVAPAFTVPNVETPVTPKVPPNEVLPNTTRAPEAVRSPVEMEEGLKTPVVKVPPTLRFCEIPSPPVTTRVPVVGEEDGVPSVNVTAPEAARVPVEIEEGLKTPADKVPPTLRFPTTPAPPLTTSAPVVGDVEAVVLVNATAPLADKAPVAMEEGLKTPADKVPPTFRLPTMPAPPPTMRAPVVGDEEEVVLVVTSGLAVMTLPEPFADKVRLWLGRVAAVSESDTSDPKAIPPAVNTPLMFTLPAMFAVPPIHTSCWTPKPPPTTKDPVVGLVELSEEFTTRLPFMSTTPPVVAANVRFAPYVVGWSVSASNSFPEPTMVLSSSEILPP